VGRGFGLLHGHIQPLRELTGYTPTSLDFHIIYSTGLVEEKRLSGSH
jgi:hypothetical protein